MLDTSALYLLLLNINALIFELLKTHQCILNRVVDFVHKPFHCAVNDVAQGVVLHDYSTPFYSGS